MYFADLTPCSYDILGPQGLSVGWLDKEHDFERGEVPARFIERLAEVCARPYLVHAGAHYCELCDLQPVQRLKAGAMSSTVILVIGLDGTFYYSPGMIHHYVVRHTYRPPAGFIRAVMGEERPGDVLERANIDELIEHLGSLPQQLRDAVKDAYLYQHCRRDSRVQENQRKN